MIDKDRPFSLDLFKSKIRRVRDLPSDQWERKPWWERKLYLELQSGRTELHPLSVGLSTRYEASKEVEVGAKATY